MGVGRRMDRFLLPVRSSMSPAGRLTYSYTSRPRNQNLKLKLFTETVLLTNVFGNSVKSTA